MYFILQRPLRKENNCPDSGVSVHSLRLLESRHGNIETIYWESATLYKGPRPPTKQSQPPDAKQNVQLHLRLTSISWHRLRLFFSLLSNSSSSHAFVAFVSINFQNKKIFSFPFVVLKSIFKIPLYTMQPAKVTDLTELLSWDI
jgi:hypothetical protein